MAACSAADTARRETGGGEGGTIFFLVEGDSRYVTMRRRETILDASLSFFLFFFCAQIVNINILKLLVVIINY